MGFKRITTAGKIPRGNELTRAMAGIGMAFAEIGTVEANIEDTLVAASLEGLETPDYRVVAVLVHWIEIHVAYINADRLIRAVSAVGNTRVPAFWAAVAMWLSKDRRLRPLLKGATEERLDLLDIGTDFHIARRGEDSRFTATCLRVPAGVLEKRKGDVLMPQELAKRHTAYHFRVLMGPSYRADMWAALAKSPQIKTADLARHCYGSFATAWVVKRDFSILS